MTAVSELLRFCLVGALGFVLDSTITLALVQTQAVGPLQSRILAFLCAAAVTFWCHGRYTFRHRSGNASLAAYVVLTAVGAMINVGVYALWIHWSGVSVTQMFVGIVIGSATALGFNFLVSRHVIFKHP